MGVPRGLASVLKWTGEQDTNQYILEIILPVQQDCILSDCFALPPPQLGEKVSPSQVMQHRQHKSSCQT